jgi:hypothetical protein
MRLVIFVLFLCFGPLRLNSQMPMPTQSAPEPQLSPQAAYDQATRSLEITRRSPQNWSEVELAALKIARENAKAACLARNPDQAGGQDLLDLAHLCAFGQQWQNVYQAASNYLAAVQSGTHDVDPKVTSDLSLAFDYKVQGSLNENNPDDAFSTAQTMLRTVAYGLYASEATNSTIDYIHFIRTEQALALLVQRQPILLAQIKTYGSAIGDTGNAIVNGASALSAVHATLPLHTLYADAIVLPFMQQLANQPKAATASYAELEAATPNSLSSEESMLIREKRRQYLLIGTHLPVLNPMGSLSSPGASAPENLNTWFGFASVFLLFPDWCNQCVAMAFNSAAKSKELLDDYHVRFLPLIAQANPPEKRPDPAAKKVPLSAKAAKEAQARSQRLHVDQQLTIKSTPDGLLEGTPTVVVPNETLDQLAATDFPLIIATDHNGVIRWIERASDDALAAGGEVDQIVLHILATWPLE